MDADLTPILEDLAAGRIDAVEANRRIGLAHAEAAQQAAKDAADRAEAERRQAERDLAESLATARSVTEPEAAGTSGSAPSDDAVSDAGTTDARTTDTGTSDAGSAAPETSSASWADIAKGLAGAAGGLASAAARAAAATVSEQVANARTTTVPPVAAAQRPQGNQGVERLVLRLVGRKVHVIADPSVAIVQVDGPHQRTRSGSTLEISSESELGQGGLDVSRLLKAVPLGDVPRILRGEVRSSDLSRLVTGRPVQVRVNPAILVDVEATGCTLAVEDVAWLGRVRVTVGLASFMGVSEVEDALVQAGSLTLRGRLDGPRSRARVESGRLHLALEDADVEVVGSSSLGRISWPEAGASGHRAGLGTGRMELSVTLGQAVVTDTGTNDD